MYHLVGLLTELLSIRLQVECMPPGKIQVVVTEYIMDNSTISLHFTGVGGAGSLRAVQIGHSEGVSRSIPVVLSITFDTCTVNNLCLWIRFLGCCPEEDVCTG